MEYFLKEGYCYLTFFIMSKRSLRPIDTIYFEDITFLFLNKEGNKSNFLNYI